MRKTMLAAAILSALTGCMTLRDARELAREERIAGQTEGVDIAARLYQCGQTEAKRVLDEDDGMGDIAKQASDETDEQLKRRNK